MPKRILNGEVVSNSSNKTVVVKVERTFKHPLYGKTIRKSSKYHAHDENNVLNVGDKVSIIECAPYSKLKRWEVMSDEGSK